MKLFTLLLIALVCNLSVNGQNRKIEFPDYENSDLLSLEIEAIELNENETILHWKAYDNPRMWLGILNECYFKNSSGKMYELLEPFDFREFSKTLTGDTSFKLSFAPFDSEEETLDFIFTKGRDKGIQKIIVNENYPSSAIECTIEGEVIDRPESKYLLVGKKGDDMRVGNHKKIPIRYGKFKTKIKSEHVEPYELIFEDEIRQGGWRPVSFFTENTHLRFVLYPQERFEENQITGGPLTDEYLAYQTMLQQMYNFCHIHPEYVLDQYPLINLKNYNAELKMWIKKEPLKDQTINLAEEYGRLWDEDLVNNAAAKEFIRQAKEATDPEIERKYWEKYYELQLTNDHLTEEAKILDDKLGKIASFIGDWEIDYMENNQSLVNFERLVYQMNLSLFTPPLVYKNAYGKTHEYIRIFESIYQPLYPNHPLTQQMQTMIESCNTIKPGGRYIDFTAPDFEGNEITLSSQIEGKITIINLWASWCGPCRRKGMELIPLYEAYKDKGFTVVGVAREEKEMYGIHAAQKDNYPWINLLEIGDKQNIWNKYGIGNSGGSLFLVDKDGTLLAINPKFEEIKEILANKLD